MSLEPVVLGELIAGAVLLALCVMGLGISFGRRDRGQRVRALEHSVQQFERKAVEAQRANEDLWERMERSETAVRELQNSIVQIPEIAQRLYAMRELREIPDSTLDLVQEISAVDSVFTARSRNSSRGLPRRERFRLGTASLSLGVWLDGSKQLPSRGGRALESAQVRQRNLSLLICRARASRSAFRHGAGASLGVLCRPSARPARRPRARAPLALISSVAIASTVVPQGAPAREDDGLPGSQQDQHLRACRPRQRRHEAPLRFPARSTTSA